MTAASSTGSTRRAEARRQPPPAPRPPRARRPWKQFSVLPGFGLSLGLTLAYASLLVLIPLAALVIHVGTMGWAEFWAKATEPRVIASYRLSFGAAFIAAVINVVFGFVGAWTLTRYRFPGRRVLDALVDLPFALPTAVSGIALTYLFGPAGWIGSRLEPLGIKIAFTPVGIVVALVLIGLPFVVRTLQPAIADLPADIEEAAATMGARRGTVFRRVLIPALLPSALTGFALAFARGVGEYGSVIFIAGNMPMRTEIAPLLIVIKLEQFDINGAVAIATVMLVLSFLMLLLINGIQVWHRRTYGGRA